MKRLLALSLGAALILSSMPTHAADQNTGSLGGKATQEASKPYSNYSVRARLASGGSGNTVPLGPDGRFAITGLNFPGDYLVELINNADGNVVCTEGPFKNPKGNIDIDCGKTPAALWLTPLAAGLAATLGVVSQSNGQ